MITGKTIALPILMFIVSSFSFESEGSSEVSNRLAT